MFREFEDEFFSGTGVHPADMLGHPRSNRQLQPQQGRSAGKELSLWSDPFGDRSLMPFGSLFGGRLFGGFDTMFENMKAQMENNPNVHCYSSSSVMTYSSDGSGGNPRVYQASTSTRAGPGGVKEVKKSVMDSESGLKKAAIEHHIGDRSHAIERSYNMKTNEAQQHEQLKNLDEGEVEVFNEEWTRKTKPLNKSVGYLAAPRQSEHRPALPAGKSKLLPPIQVEKHPTSVKTEGHDGPMKAQRISTGEGSHSTKSKVDTPPAFMGGSHSTKSKVDTPAFDPTTLVSGSSKHALSEHHVSTSKSTTGRERVQYATMSGQGQGHHGTAEQTGVQGGIKKKVKIAG